jgi:hypothetical protein
MNNDDVSAAIRRLPQCERINPDDAKKWISAVLEHEPEKLLWRINRLSAFGGSDIGSLLLELMGEDPPFQTGADIINDRLMKTLPVAPLYHMKKGNVLENCVIQAILRLYGGEYDFKTADAYKNNHLNLPRGINGNIDFPWITKNGHRILVDTKIPVSGMPPEANWKKDFLYCTQLNTYQMLAPFKGVEPFERIVNAHLELPKVLTDAYCQRLMSGGKQQEELVINEMVELLKHERDGLRINFQEHEINPTITINGQSKKMVDAITEVSELSFQCVIDGHVPEVVSTPVHLSEAKLQTLSKIEEDLFHYEALQSVVSLRAGSLRDQIVILNKGIQTSDNLSQTGFYNIKSSSSIDTAELSVAAHRYGFDVDTLRKDDFTPTPTDYDVHGLFAAAESAGVDVSAFAPKAPLDPAKIQRVLADHNIAHDRILKPEIGVRRSTKKPVREALSSITAQYENPLTHLHEDAITLLHEDDAIQESTPHTVDTVQR